MTNACNWRETKTNKINVVNILRDSSFLARVYLIYFEFIVFLLIAQNKRWKVTFTFFYFPPTLKTNANTQSRTEQQARLTAICVLVFLSLQPPLANYTLENEANTRNTHSLHSRQQRKSAAVVLRGRDAKALFFNRSESWTRWCLFLPWHLPSCSSWPLQERTDWLLRFRDAFFGNLAEEEAKKLIGQRLPTAMRFVISQNSSKQACSHNIYCKKMFSYCRRYLANILYIYKYIFFSAIYNLNSVLRFMQEFWAFLLKNFIT